MITDMERKKTANKDNSKSRNASNHTCSSGPSTSSLDHDHRYEKKKTANKDNSKPRNASNRACSSGPSTSSSDQDHIYAKKRTANKDNSKPKKSRVVDRYCRKTLLQDWKSPREKINGIAHVEFWRNRLPSLRTIVLHPKPSATKANK
ncbi:hypothetical protein CEXT_71201 [Caerostris extrusa]|uniref:Uncharacterized protein n=1 Tax=Caerostris extrusa TaxID=172846 RepID=A0AAV4YAN6_CAEEX|nr:hypothetical protein CEXT_71201 [Caerostris extrusa]